MSSPSRAPSRSPGIRTSTKSIIVALAVAGVALLYAGVSHNATRADAASANPSISAPAFDQGHGASRIGANPAPLDAAAPSPVYTPAYDPRGGVRNSLEIESPSPTF